MLRIFEYMSGLIYMFRLVLHISEQVTPASFLNKGMESVSRPGPIRAPRETGSAGRLTPPCNTGVTDCVTKLA